MSIPARVETVTLMPTGWAFEFHRDGGDDVWATVALGFEFSLVVTSDSPRSPREWIVEEIGIPNEISRASLRSPAAIPYESELGRALAKAWDNYVSREARAVYTPGNRGSAKIGEEAP